MDFVAFLGESNPISEPFLFYPIARPQRSFAGNVYFFAYLGNWNHIFRQRGQNSKLVDFIAFFVEVITGLDI